MNFNQSNRYVSLSAFADLHAPVRDAITFVKNNPNKIAEVKKALKNEFEQPCGDLFLLAVDRLLAKGDLPMCFTHWDDLMFEISIIEHTYDGAYTGSDYISGSALSLETYVLLVALQQDVDETGALAFGVLSKLRSENIKDALVPFNPAQLYVHVEGDYFSCR